MCHREERRRFLRIARNKSEQSQCVAPRMRLPRPFRARNDNVNSFIAFVLVAKMWVETEI